MFVVCTSMHVLVCMYVYVCTSMYVCICMYLYYTALVKWLSNGIYIPVICMFMSYQMTGKWWVFTLRQKLLREKIAGRGGNPAGSKKKILVIGSPPKPNYKLFFSFSNFVVVPPPVPPLLYSQISRKCPPFCPFSGSAWKHEIIIIFLNIENQTPFRVTKWNSRTGTLATGAVALGVGIFLFISFKMASITV
jgi:hypothetical protein